MRPFRTLVMSAVAVLLAAGCGSVGGSGSPAGTASASPSAADNGVAALSADQILAKAKAALQGAEAVRIKGRSGRGTEQFDLDMRFAAASAQGTIAVGGQQIELRRIGQTVYLKGSRELWTSRTSAAAAELLTGKWLKTPLTEARFAELAELTDLSKAADGILDPDGKITKGERKTVAGTPAIGLVSSGSDGGTLYVATTGEPYPLQIRSTDPKDPAQVDFSDYGKTITVSPPAAELVVDVTKLGR